MKKEKYYELWAGLVEKLIVLIVASFITQFGYWGCVLSSNEELSRFQIGLALLGFLFTFWLLLCLLLFYKKLIIDLNASIEEKEHG